MSEPTEPDWFLRKLMELAEHKGIEFDVSLWFGGSQIVGRIIGARKYFQVLGDEVAKTVFKNDQSAGKVTSEAFVNVGALYSRDRIDAGARAPEHIHLADAYFLVAGQGFQPANGPGLLWRGRLTEVSGFTLGRLMGAPSSLVAEPAK